MSINYTMIINDIYTWLLHNLHTHVMEQLREICVQRYQVQKWFCFYIQINCIKLYIKFTSFRFLLVKQNKEYGYYRKLKKSTWANQRSWQLTFVKVEMNIYWQIKHELVKTVRVKYISGDEQYHICTCRNAVVGFYKT